MASSGENQAIVVRQPTAGVLGVLFVSVMTGVLALGLLGLGAGLVFNGEAVGLIVIAVGAFIGLLFNYVVRDMRGRIGWRIAVGRNGIDVHLPRGRSLTHRLEPEEAHVRFDEMDAIEARLEAYPAMFGLANMQRCYALRRKNGQLIILGEDRALRTDFASSTLLEAVREIVRRGHVEVRELGMVEGNIGFLGVCFASAPPWDAPALGAERQAALWQMAERTGATAKAASLATLLRSR